MSRNLWSSPRSQPSPTKDLYWFAHAADPPVERPRGLWQLNREQSKEELSSDGQPGSPQKTELDNELEDLEGNAERANNLPPGKSGSPVRPDGKDVASLSVKEREERARLFRERQEEERMRRLLEMQQASEQAQRFREQQEEERRKKIEELRLRDMERRQAVEERKRQIWEAELERKEAILRRNLERESKLEARRNAQRNSLCFAFGSSTPRTLNLDMAGINAGHSKEVLFASGRPGGIREYSPVESNNYHPPEEDGTSLLWGQSNSVATHRRQFEHKADDSTSAIGVDKDAASRQMLDGIRDCLTNLDLDANNSNFRQESPSRSKQSSLTGSGAVVGDDIMSRSMGSLSTYSRGRRKTDLMPVMPRERDIAPHPRPTGNQGKRAMSMSRLDQLARPRRRFEPAAHSGRATSTSKPSGSYSSSSSMSKSMFNLTNSSSYNVASRKSFGTSLNSGRGGKSGSMTHLSVFPPKSETASACDACPTPKALSSFPSSNKRLSQSMMHLAITPRPTRTSRLRADALLPARRDRHGSSALMSNRKEVPLYGQAVALSASRKEPAHSPTRPRSSMSATSEQSTASSMASVNLRPRTGPKRPRPISIAGTAPDHRPTANSQASAGEVRQSRPLERKPVPSSRAKSVGAERPRKMDIAPSSTGKPVPPPKPTPPAASVPRISRKEHKPKKVEKLSTEPVEGGSAPLQQDASTDKAESRQTALASEANDISEPSTETTSTSAPPKPRIVSEEEARAALAEKRRLAREQAEREAELERQRQEQLRQQAEEEARRKIEEQKKKLEEQKELERMQAQLEAKKLEDIAQEQSKMQAESAEIKDTELQEPEFLTEEEKEQKAKEDAERAAREEEERLAKEEQERKAREEAEKLRKELEERLKREEAERAERKKRVEEIMSRTRGKNKQFSPKHEVASSTAVSDDKVEPVKPDVIPTAHDEQLKRPGLEEDESATGDKLAMSPEKALQMQQQPCLLGDSGLLAGQSDTKQDTTMDLLITQQQSADSDSIVQGVGGAKLQLGPEVIPASDKTLTEVDSLPYELHSEKVSQEQITNGVSETNGYSSHEDDASSMSEISPEEKLKDTIDIINTMSTTIPPSLPSQQPSYEFEQLIDIGETTSQATVDNLLINADDVNSNRVPGAPFIAFEDNISRKQEASITDLLS